MFATTPSDFTAPGLSRRKLPEDTSPEDQRKKGFPGGSHFQRRQSGKDVLEGWVPEEVVKHGGVQKNYVDVPTKETRDEVLESLLVVVSPALTVTVIVESKGAEDDAADEEEDEEVVEEEVDEVVDGSAIKDE